MILRPFFTLNKVMLARKLDDSRVCAIKRLPKESRNVEAVIERVIMSQQSKWLLTALESFQDNKYLYLISDFMFGGCLSNLAHRPDFSVETVKRSARDGEEIPLLPLEMARFYLAELLLAIEELHSKGYIHRDIKAENALIHRDGHLKLMDFGAASKLSDSGKVRGKHAVGTPDYIAPEVLAAEGRLIEYGTEVDMWSYGVTIYEILVGELPFYAESLLHTYHRIQNYQKTLELDGKGLSEEARDLLKNLLCKPEERFSISQIKTHPFFSDIDFGNLLGSEPLFKPVICNDLREYLCEDDEPTTLPTFDQKKTCKWINQLSFVGFSWSPKSLVIKEKTSLIVRSRSSIKSSKSSVRLATISLSGSSLPLKDEADDRDALIESLTIQLQERSEENAVLLQRIETLKETSLIDRQKIAELVRKLEETIIQGSPVSSRRSSSTNNDRQGYKKMQQDYKKLEQRLLHETQIKELLLWELAEIKGEKVALERRLAQVEDGEAKSLKSFHSMSSLSNYFTTPTKSELSVRSRRDTEGSISLFKSIFGGKDNGLTEPGVLFQGTLKIPDVKSKKFAWKKMNAILTEDCLTLKDKRSSLSIPIRNPAFWIQPVSAKEFPQINAKQTLSCFKIRYLEDSMVHPSDVKVIKGPSRDDIVKTLEEEHDKELKMREGAAQMLLAANDSKAAQSQIQVYLDVIDVRIASLESKISRLKICNQDNDNSPPAPLYTHLFSPAIVKNNVECEACYRDNYSSNGLKCDICELVCHQECLPLSDLSVGCQEIALLRSVPPLILMASNKEESRKWIDGIRGVHNSGRWHGNN